MISQLQLQDFKGHRRTEMSLGRFTLLVGDNASGKTSVLDALQLQGALDPDPVAVLHDERAPDDLLRRGAKGPMYLAASGTTGDQAWRTTLQIDVPPQPGKDPDRRWTATLSGTLGTRSFAATAAGSAGGGSATGAWSALTEVLGRVALYRLRADRIAAAAYASQPDAAVELDGTNTAVALANMKLGNDEAFERVEIAMRRLIPGVQRVRIHPATVLHASPRGDSVVGSKLYFDFVGAKDVPAHNASHGTLIVLALLTVLHGARRPNLILLDDFDHALHPRAQMELVRMLKELLQLDEFQDLQVVATTHSPYVLDEVDASDVQVFALRDDGTVASKRLSEHPAAAKTKGMLRAGQLWSLDAERDWVLRDRRHETPRVLRGSC